MKVLIVEDQKDTSEYLSTLLQSYDIIVHTCTNSLQALELVCSNQYNWAIIDLNLEGSIQGEELIEELKKYRPEIKMIVSTGLFLSNDQKNKFIKLGVKAVLEKPYQEDVLINLLFNKLIN